MLGTRHATSDEHRLSRREALRSTLTIVGMALLAACQPIPSASAPSTSAPVASPTSVAPATAAPVATPSGSSAGSPTIAPAGGEVVGAGADLARQNPGTPAPGGTLRMGFPGDIAQLDGHFYIGTQTHTLYHVWDRLGLLDEKLQLQPRLGESFDFGTDYTKTTVKLRRGVKYHTGREFTSADAKWNLERVKDAKIGGGIFAGLVAPMKVVDTPDPYTLVVNSDPWPHLPFVLQTLNMLDPQTDVNTPTGTGPFSFVELVQGDHLTLKKNPNYWAQDAQGRALPYLDQLYYQAFRDPQSMAAQLEARVVDVVDQPTLRDTARFQQDANFQVLLHTNTGGDVTIIANTTQAPLDNKVVRQALNWAVDRQRIVDTVLLGIGEPHNLPWFPSSPAFDPTRDKTYTFNLDKAKSLLDSAGISNLSLDFNYSSASPELASMAQIYQADLARIGVTLNLKATDPVQLIQQQFGVSYTGLITGTTLFGNVQPSMQSGNPSYNPLRNYAGFKTEEWSKLAYAIATETDPVKQKQVYGQWSDYALDQSWIMPVASNLPRTVMSSRVRGLVYNMAELLDATRAFLVS